MTPVTTAVLWATPGKYPRVPMDTPAATAAVYGTCVPMVVTRSAMVVVNSWTRPPPGTVWVEVAGSRTLSVPTAARSQRHAATPGMVSNRG